MDKSVYKCCNPVFIISAFVFTTVLQVVIFSGFAREVDLYKSISRNRNHTDNINNADFNVFAHQNTSNSILVEYSYPGQALTVDSATQTEYVPVDTAVRTYTYKHRRDIMYDRSNCTTVHFPSTSLPVTALASFPGSGNSWTRHLIELITGHTYI